MSNPAFLELKHLHKQYGKREILRGVDFSIPAGGCYALVGPNGAGKSTTVRAIQGLTPLDSGEIRMDGQTLSTLGAAGRARIGVVPQMDNLDPDFSVEENLWTYGRYFRLPKTRIRQRSTELLDFMALSSYARQPISALSGGMQRRLTIARALINAPQLLLLDEPTTGLDPQARHLIWQRLRDLRRQGTTLLLTTHYMDEAERLADQVGIIDQGQILAQDTPRGLIESHIPGEVLELRRLDGSTPDPENWHQQQVMLSERVGDTLICYGQNLQQVMTHFVHNPDYRWLQRPASLEDVFLRLTGRNLREDGY
ncbi:ATP-binding cassette domain-containing protein [Acidithiobacillus concretivorus]|uniref:ATP-binding cassette domain-containing protein n=1 Tax=Acidithiobacillus concretivorus TaxID=3063952 RepID=A0ABS5ZN29_9PROT|nr:ATP-binding cassette domain-containing protein [Acidithiobacillus concretivorus]